MKKSLALLLAVLMLVTMFPVSVFAAGDEGDENVVVITEANGVEEGASTIDNEDHPYILVITLASGISMTETSDAGIAEALGGAYSYADSLAMMGAGDASAAKYELILNEDVTLEKMLTIPAGRDVTIDLNGHKITSGYQEGSTTNHIYVFENHGTMTITGNGVINTRGIFNYGALTLESGTINAIDCNGGYGVRNYAGSFTMNGGTIATTYEDGDVPGEGYDASPVRVDEDATFVMNAGTINNVSNYTVAVDNYGTTTINGGELTSVHTTVANAGTMTINGGKFTCNGLEGITAHALWAADGTTIINGGTFDGKDNYNGFNVDASEGAKVEIKGGNFLPVHSGSLYGEGEIVVSGGTFFDQIPEDRLAPGYELNENGEVVAKPILPSAEISNLTETVWSITDSEEREAFNVQLKKINANTSLTVEVYHNDILLTTTTLKESLLPYVNNVTSGEGFNRLTVNIVLWGKASGSWDTTVEYDNLTDENIPNYIKVYCDGELVAEGTREFDADWIAAYQGLEITTAVAPAYVAMIGEQGYATLAEALAAAQSGDEIVLLADVELIDTLIIDKVGSITINGNGKIVSLADGFANTNAWGAAIMVGNSGYGDGDTANHALTIKNVTFDGITGNSILRVQGVTLTMSECTVVNCDSTNTDQGMLRIDSTVATVTGCVFEDNAATKIVGHNHNIGGSQAAMTIEDCQFTGNMISGPGVIVLSSDAGCTIKDSEFVGNNVTCSNGATVYLGFTENNVVTGNLFENNTVTGNATSGRVAGALFVGYTNTISNNAFVDNSATNASGASANSVCVDTYFGESIDLSGNYWGGDAPDAVAVGSNEDAYVNTSYYTTYEDGVLGGLRKIGLNGSGTETNPYQIGTAEELFLFAEKVNDGTYKNVYVVLTADIDLEQEDWISIGTSSNPFTGTFDGKGYTISNLWCYERGLFGYTSTGNYVDFGKTGRATIKNLTLNGVEVYNQSNNAVGGLVGQAGQNTEISDVTVTGYISIYGYGYVGGLVGQGYVHVDNCHVIGVDDEQNSKSTIDAGYWAVGGIVGHAGSEGGASITNCSVENVNIQSAIYGAGAIAGVGTKGPIENVSAKDVSIRAESTPDANGLLVGCNYKQITGDCHVENVVLTVADTVVASPQDMAAKIGDKFYAAFASAVAAAQSGDEIVVLNDLTLTNGVEVAAGKTITLDLNGKTITGTPTEAKAYSVITNKGNLTITGDGAIVCDHQMAGSTGYAVNTIVNSGTLTIDGATIENKSTATNQIGYAIDNNSTSTDAILVVKSGDVKVSGSYYYDGVRLFCNNLTKENSVTVEGGSVSSIWMQNPSDGATEKDTKEVKGSVSISGGTVGALYLEPSTAFDAAITGGNIGKVEYFATAEGRDVTGFISGGTFFDQISEDRLADGYVALPDLNGNFVVGTKPTATVNDLGMTTVPAGEYGVWNGSSYTGTSTEDMPLSFVMQFLADQSEADMANSPYADWYGDFVITFSGIEGGSFVADGCYLAGHYGTFGWVKVPVDGMTIENGVRYPVMLGVGFGIDYQYICSGVEDFKCAMYLTPEVLAANPNIEVKLELAVVDSSKGLNEAANALVKAENIYEVNKHEYDAEDFVVKTYVAQIGEQKFESLAEAFAAGGDIVLLKDVALDAALKVAAGKTVTLDLAGHVISGVCNAGQSSLVYIENGAALTVKDSAGEGKITYAQGSSNVGWTVDVKGAFTLESGIIELTGSSWSIGYAVEVRPNSWGTEYTEGSIFVMNGGSIVSSDGGVRVASSSAEGHKNVSASFEMNGGSIDAAWDGVFIQQSDAIYDDLSFVMNGGTIESDLNPVRVYGPAPTGYVNDSNCMSITLAGGTMTYTGTEAQTWVIDGILRVGGGSSAATIVENGSLTVSAEIAQSAAAPEGFKWGGNENGTYTLAACDYVAQIGEEKFESLAEAFKVGGDIVLLKDVEITSTITLAAGKTATLDLNGKTIDGMGNVRIALMSYGDLTLKDSSAEQTGVIKAGIGTAGNAVNICAGSFTMESGSIYSLNNGILIDEKAATVTIKGGKITAEPATNNSAVFYISSTSDTVLNIEGGELVGYNGILLWNNTEINITGGTITAEGRLGIQGNGSKDNTKINISGGTLTGKEAAIYHPQGGDLNISGDAVLTGNTGIIVKGGNVTISGGTIRAIGAAGVYEPEGSGFNSTGDALYVEVYDNSTSSENYGTPVVTVTGGTFISANAQAVASYANPNNAVEALDEFISGGTFNTALSEELCAKGYIPTENADGTYGVKEGSYVAQIGEKKYESLAEAIDAANGGEVVLLIPYVVAAGETVTLDLKGVTVKQSVACTASYDMILNKGTLTITDSVGGGKISFTDTSAGDPAATWGSYTIRNEGTLVIQNVTIENLSEQNVKGQAFAHTTLAIFQYSGSTTINSGKISTPNYRSVRLWSGEMTINGGEFEGQVWVQCVNDTSKLTINGGSFKPCWNDGSSVFVNNSGYEAELNVTGGIFETKIGANDPEGLNGDKIVGGTFTEAAKSNTNTALLGEDCVFVENAGGTYGIVKVDYVAQVGDKKYESFDEALAAAQDGDTVQLISDVTVTDVITILKNITLDLNGHTLTAGGLAFFGYGAVVDNGEVTGLLAVPYRFLMMNNATYPMLPVWNEAGTGYVFTTVNPQAKVVSVDEDSFYVNFRPSISREGVSTLAWFANGAADHGISFAIKIHCFKDDRDVEAFEFVVEDEFIKTVYTNGTSFKLNVNGATTMFDEYKVEIIVASDTNIAYSTICSTTFIPSTVNAQ